MIRVVFQRRFGKGSLFALALLLIVAAGTVSAARPGSGFAASLDTCGYNPSAAPSPNGGTVIFNENTVTRAIGFFGVGLSGHVGVFANDESGLLIGSGGTPSSAVPGQVYGEAVPPSFGTGSDADFRRFAPTIYLTDITANANATGGDWENGGQPATTGASALYGSWSPTLGTKPVNKNNWVLGPHADPIPATDAFGGTTTSFNEGYGAEVTWNTPGLVAYDPTTNSFVAVQPGHTYRAQSLTHDTDQNKGNGDVGEVCTTFSIPVANLTITKTADAASVNAGEQIGFTVEVKNTGNAPATNAALNDSLPAGSGSGVTWAVDNSTGTPAKFVLSGAQGSQTLGLASSTIPVGADYTIHITASTSATECGVYDNTATLTSSDSNPPPAEAQEACKPAHVTITKTADASPVNAGDQVGFTVEVKNTGTGVAKGATLTDALPGGSGTGVTWAVDNSVGTPAKFVLAGGQGSQTLTLASSTLAAGADYTIHITATTSATECGVYDNTATLTTTNANNPQPASAEEVCKPAHVTITKTADASPVNAGDQVGFTVEVKNTGNGVAKGATLTDALPGGSGSGVTWAVDNSVGTPAKFVLAGGQGSQTLTLASSTLAAGADYTIHITATTSATECGVYDNTATLTTTNANNPNPASAEEVCKPANVTVTKTADASPVNAGDLIGFTVEVKNTGTGAAKGASLVDPLPAGSGSGVTWAVDNATGTPAKFVLAGSQGSQTLSLASSTIPAGADYTIHITATTSATECGVYDNTATLTTTNANNPNPASAEEVCNQAHVTIAKTADASPVNAGDLIGFTVEVKNTGSGVAKGASLNDALPGGSGSGVTWAVDFSTGTPARFVLAGGQGSQTLTLASSTLPAGADYTIHITASTSATECGVYDNTATLTTTNANNPNPASAEEVCKPAHVTITKTADASPVDAGDLIGFTVEVKNTGPGVAKGASLVDPLPGGSGSGVTWSVDFSTGTPSRFVLAGSQGSQTLSLASSTIPAGADYTIHITASTSATECGVYDNTATLTTTNANDPNPASAEEVCGPAHVTITKAADASPVNAGDQIGFTVEVKNTGSGVAKGASLNDALPGGSGSGVTWAVDFSTGTPARFVLAGGQGSQKLKLASSTLPAGADYTIHITATTSATECGVYDNTATLTTTNAGNPPPASAEEVCNQAHVTITKTADASPVSAGDQIGFTVEVKNTGPGVAKGASLNDALPGGSGSGVTWGVDGSTGTPARFVLAGSQGSQTLSLASSTIPAGADYKIHITATTSATECGVYDNTATLTTTNANNPNPASAEEVCNQASIQIVKTADAAQVNQGEQIGFTLTVYNGGSGAAKGVKLSDPLPTNTGLSWTIANQGTGWGGTCAIGNGTLNCGPVTVPAGLTPAASTFTVHITSPTGPGTGGLCPNRGVVTNTGSVTTTNDGSGQSTATTCVEGITDLQITKTGSPATQTVTKQPYGNITWTMVVTNNGPDVDTNVVVGDAMPAGNLYVSSFTPKGSCTGGPILSCSLGTLQVGESVMIILVTTPTVTGQQKNTATVAGELPETTYANNVASATVKVIGIIKPPVCTRVIVRARQFEKGRATTLHIEVMQGRKAVKGVRVRIKGAGVSVITSRSNASGKITRTIRPRKYGIVSFRPMVTFACTVQRGVIAPPPPPTG